MTSASAPAAPLPRHAVQVSRNVLRAGSTTRRFREGDARSLLTAYLALIRQLRDQRRARSIELRSTDIESLAAYLGRPGAEVVEQLAEMMGATRSQRATMVALFGTGALVIALAGSTALGRADRGPANVFEPRSAVEAVVPDGTPVVIPAAASNPTSPTTAPTASAAPTTTLPASTSTDAPIASAAPAPPAQDEPPTIIDTPAPTTTPRPRSTQPAPTEPAETTAPVTDDAPDDTVVTDIGTPPIPPATAAPEEPVVTNIGTPPIPPATAAPEETVVTDIGTPPIPPPPDTAADTATD